MSEMVKERRFVPREMDVADFQQVRGLLQQLLDRPIASAEDLDAWLKDLSELMSVVSEARARRYIAKSCDTVSEEKEKAYLGFVENVMAPLKPVFFEVQKKYLAQPQREALTDMKFCLLEREWQTDVDLFRPENVPLQVQDTKLSSAYDKICAAMTVEFQGKEYTLQQLARFLEETDRATRQEAWELSARRRMEDREKINGIFSELLGVREKIAQNAGLNNYRDYVWRSYQRFDYTPEDCYRFADAIEASVVPLVEELDRQRQEELGVDSLRPWDLSVDVKGRAPLRPFDPERVEEFVDKVQTIFGKLKPELAEDFLSLRRHNNLDLDSRKGKQPGGYQSSLEEVREPFIFMNAAGVQRDVETLLHEGGHAFHYLRAREEELVFVRHAPLEFAEVASMSMELFATKHLGVFYANPEEAGRAERKMLEGVIRFFPWMATIDMFQHWLYTHEGHSEEARRQAWLDTQKRFSSSVVDWSGYEEERASAWQRQLHLFHAPFYYIEYGIAQLGALQLWVQFREQPERTLENYLSALKLGGTRPLPQLFEAAGIKFEFTRETIEPLMQAVREELAALPA